MDDNMRMCMLYTVLRFSVFNAPDIMKRFWRQKMSKSMRLCRFYPIIVYMPLLYHCIGVFEEKFPLCEMWMHVNEITSHSFIVEEKYGKIHTQKWKKVHSQIMINERKKGQPHNSRKKYISFSLKNHLKNYCNRAALWRIQSQRNISG